MTDTSTPQPNDQMVEPEFGNDEMQTWLDSLGEQQSVDLPSLLSTPAAQMSQEEAPAPEEEESDDESEDEAESHSEPESTTSSSSDPTADTLVVNGQHVSKADIERLYQFDQYLRSNPDAAARVNSVLTTPAPTGQPNVPAPETTSFTPPTPPEDIDLDDPAVKFVWDQQVAMAQRLHSFEQAQQKQTQLLTANQDRITAQQANADMEVVLSKFRNQFPNLNDDDIATIRNDARPLLPAVMQQLPPIDALKRSMELAAWANADLRSKLSDPETTTPTTKQRSAHRKTKATQISGSPRSAPRVEARPQYRNDRDMVNALAQEFADQLSGRQ